MEGKQEIKNIVNNLTTDLGKLNREIYQNPELPFQESNAAKLQVDLLKDHGFQVTFPTGNLDTAFEAVFSSNSGEKDTPKPIVAFLSEYDALPELGHACGHNLIATASVGAGIALSKVIKNTGGTVKVIGTPAEEGGGGKVHLLEAGVFDSVDFAMMIHPGPKNMIGRGGLACTTITVEAHGKPAHSAAPHNGVNALSTVINIFNELDTLRSTIRDCNKINGIITSGGTASNVIPDYAKAFFTIRSSTSEELEELISRFKNICQGAELLTGAQVESQHDMIYTERYPNKNMGECFKSHLESMEEQVTYPSPNEILGSSDIGNISKTVPTIHPYIKISESSIGGHTAEFAREAGKQMAENKAVQAAKALAMTGYDLLTDDQFQTQVVNEFHETISHGNKN